jgi:hypothetical protein
MMIVVSGIFALLTLLAWLDLRFAREGAPSLGIRLETWSRKNPWFAAALLVVLGALISHFVLNPWPPLP